LKATSQFLIKAEAWPWRWRYYDHSKRDDSWPIYTM